MSAMKIWAIMATLTAVVLGSFATGAAVTRIAKLQRQPAAPQAPAPEAVGDGTAAAGPGGSSFVESIRRRLRGNSGADNSGADNAGGDNAAPAGSRSAAVRRSANASSNLGLDAGTEAAPLPRSSATTPVPPAPRTAPEPAPQPAAPAPAPADPFAADPWAAQANPSQAGANDPWNDPFLQGFNGFNQGGTWGGEGEGGRRRGREDGEGGRWGGGEGGEGGRWGGGEGEGGGWGGDD